MIDWHILSHSYSQIEKKNLSFGLMNPPNPGSLEKCARGNNSAKK